MEQPELETYCPQFYCPIQPLSSLKNLPYRCDNQRNLNNNLASLVNDPLIGLDNIVPRGCRFDLVSETGARSGARVGNGQS
jgi:hypothetical protein